jgi:Cu2+-exporting ATPase
MGKEHKHDMHKDQRTGHNHNSGKDHDHQNHGHGGHNHHEHHAHMIEDFRKRFWISLVITVPILLLSPMIQKFIGLQDSLRFAGDKYILFVLSSSVFVYGGFPFLVL